jgi:signal transduction histidine kinase
VDASIEELRNALRAAGSELDHVRLQLSAAKGEIEDLRKQAGAAARARANFLATLSHEVKNQLTAVLGYCDLMTGNREYTGVIRLGAQHVVTLMDDIWSIVLHEAGKLPLRETLIDIDAFVRETLPLVPGTARGGVEPRWKPETVDLPRLHCDPTRLRQILLNVVGNAVKFAKPGGQVEIGADLSDGLTFFVRDDGIGIKHEDIPRVLRPFERVESPYSPNRKPGLGLGLPVAKALMEAHGGSLGVDSTPGIGTTVRLTFPAERIYLGTAPAHSKVGADNTPAEGGRLPATPRREKGCILIVDDERLPATYFKDVLQAHGYATRLAMSGGAAVSLARDSRPDLILMDIRLYDSMTGFEAVYWLRTDASTRRIPIVGTTAFITIPERWMLAGGCDAFVPKPVLKTEEFLHTVDRILDAARLNPGEAQLEEETIDVKDILHDLVQHIDPVTTPHGIAVSWQASEDKLPNLFCDRHSLRKILWDSISFASFEINQGGQIDIRTEMADGFAFVIAHNRWREGPALGFASMERLVERCGGNISKVSAPELGTTLRIAFPADRVVGGTVH